MSKKLNKERYTLRIDKDILKDLTDHCDEYLIQKNLLIEELIKSYLESKLYLNYK